MRFSRSRRLTSANEIERVSQHGSPVRGRVCSARIIQAVRLRGRCAIVVPKHGHTAVLRNRLKRQTREMVREHILPFGGRFDIVIRMRREAYDAERTLIRADLLKFQRELLLVKDA